MSTAVAQLTIERHVQLTKEPNAEKRRLFLRRAATTAEELAGGTSRASTAERRELVCLAGTSRRSVPRPPLLEEDALRGVARSSESSQAAVAHALRARCWSVDAVFDAMPPSRGQLELAL